MENKNSGWGEGPKPMKNYWDTKDSVPSIPTINTIADANTLTTAPPTAYIGQKVADLDALNKKIVLPTKTETGIDLSLLTSVVKPVEVVYENDELWDYQHLIIEISQIIRNQKEEPSKPMEESEPFSEYEFMPFDDTNIA
jgi:Intraflagellar transport protein 43